MVITAKYLECGAILLVDVMCVAAMSAAKTYLMHCQHSVCDWVVAKTLEKHSQFSYKLLTAKVKVWFHRDLKTSPRLYKDFIIFIG